MQLTWVVAVIKFLLDDKAISYMFSTMFILFLRSANLVHYSLCAALTFLHVFCCRNRATCSGMRPSYGMKSLSLFPSSVMKTRPIIPLFSARLFSSVFLQDKSAVYRGICSVRETDWCTCFAEVLLVRVKRLPCHLKQNKRSGGVGKMFVWNSKKCQEN